MRWTDVEPGPTDTDTYYLAEFSFKGTAAEFPERVRLSLGPNGNGCRVLIPDAVTATIYGNAVEDAMIAECARLGFPTLLRTDCYYPSFVRGS